MSQFLGRNGERKDRASTTRNCWTILQVQDVDFLKNRKLALVFGGESHIKLAYSLAMKMN